MNNVCIVGRLTGDPEVRMTNNGKDVCSFSVAVDRTYKQDGQPTADFFRCTGWGHTAKFVGDYLGKGRLVAVSGRMQQKQWTDKDGATRRDWELIADNVSAIGPKPDGSVSAAQEPAHGSQPSPSAPDEYDPFADN